MSCQVRLALFLFLLLAARGSEAFAQKGCSPAEFMAKEPDSIIVSDYSKIGFLRTATKEQYALALEELPNGIGFGLMNQPLDYELARDIAKAEAQAVNFDFGSEYYDGYLPQRLVGNAKAMYVDCLRTQTIEPRLVMWLDRREGEYYFLHAIWVGSDSKAKGALNKREAVEDDVSIVKIADMWQPKTETEIVVKAGRTDGGMVAISVGQQTHSFVFVGDPQRVRMLSVEQPGQAMSVASGGGASCDRQAADQCLVPAHINGYLLPGTAKFSSAPPLGTGFEVTKESPLEVCVRVWALATACQTEVRINGQPIVVERYPSN